MRKVRVPYRRKVRGSPLKVRERQHYKQLETASTFVTTHVLGIAGKEPGRGMTKEGFRGKCRGARAASGEG